MKALRLRNKLVLGAVAISAVMASAFMLAVSWVTSQQYFDQSSATLNKASKTINDNLIDRKNSLLYASRQLAAEKNLGSTIWYLGQYEQSDVGSEILSSTYQKLLRDTYKIGRVARLSRIAIYDSSGRLVSFALFGSHGDQVGFVERYPSPVFHVAMQNEGEELNLKNLQKMHSFNGLGLELGDRLPSQERVRYAVVNSRLAIESRVPVMGETFNPGSGKQEFKQLGLVVGMQALDEDFVGYLSRLTDVKINVFTQAGYSSGDLPGYLNPVETAHEGERLKLPSLNEISVGGLRYYQRLIPLCNGQQRIGSIAALQSQAIIRKNIWEMERTLGLIAAACLLLIFPFVWYLANSISRPLILLSKIFRDVAGERETLNEELGVLADRRGDELGELTQSFMGMNDAVNQKIQLINEINASLEDKVARRTMQLCLANEELTKLARHDVLTGLPNRQLVSDRLVQALVVAKRDQTRVALMFIDLDEFKPINDTQGHAIGDLMLKETAGRIQHCIREMDTVSRIGGDEFLVLLPVIEAVQDAVTVAEKIRFALNQPFVLAGQSLRISSSIGIAIYPEHGSDESALLRNADSAMYDAKNSGRNAVKLFEQPILADQPKFDF